jgi:hypothetical protein
VGCAFAAFDSSGMDSEDDDTAAFAVDEEFNVLDADDVDEPISVEFGAAADEEE